MYNLEPITQLLPIVSLTGNDVIPIVDVNDTTQSPVGTTKKVSVLQLQEFIIGGMDWVTVTTGPVSLVANLGYIANGLSVIDFTLPVSANVGDSFFIEGLGLGLFQINQNAGQHIIFDSFQTTVGVSGHIQSTNPGDGLTIMCVVANTTFKVRSAIGTLLTI